MIISKISLDDRSVDLTSAQIVSVLNQGKNWRHRPKLGTYTKNQCAVTLLIFKETSIDTGTLLILVDL